MPPDSTKGGRKNEWSWAYAIHSVVVMIETEDYSIKFGQSIRSSNHLIENIFCIVGVSRVKRISLVVSVCELSEADGVVGFVSCISLYISV